MLKVKIKKGAKIFQDFHFGRWPACLPPSSEYEGEEYRYRTKNPDLIFDAEWKGRHWDCRRKGYGVGSKPEEYGNGSIFVIDEDGVEILFGVEND